MSATPLPLKLRQGYCWLHSERLIFGRLPDKDENGVPKALYRTNRWIILSYGLWILIDSYLALLAYQWGEGLLTGFCIGAIALLFAWIIRRVQFTSVGEISRSTIQHIRFYTAVPGWRRATFIITHVDSQQHTLVQKVQLPGWGRISSDEVRQAAHWIQSEFPSQFITRRPSDI